MNFEDMDLKCNLIIFQDGLETVNYFTQLLKDIETELASGINPKLEGTLQPVSLLLLDVNMPILNGLQVLLQVKDKFAQLESKLSGATTSASSDHSRTSRVKIVRPLIAYLS